MSTPLEAPRRRNSRRAWLLALAGLATLIAVLLWLIGFGEEHARPEETSPAESAPGSLAPRQLPSLAAPLASGEGSVAAEPPAPAPLQPDESRLEVVVTGSGLVAEQPVLDLRRADGSWKDIRRCFGQVLSWTSLPPGDYVLEALGGGWQPDAASLRLAAGDTCRVALTPLTSCAVRVTGARSGRPLTEYRVQVDTRWAGSDGVRQLPATHDVSDPVGRCTVSGLRLHSYGQALEAARFLVLPDEHEPLISAWVPAQQLRAGASVEILAPEVAIQGKVRGPQGASPAEVLLLRASTAPFSMEHVVATRFAHRSDSRAPLMTATPDENGDFAFVMSSPPEEAVFLASFSLGFATSEAFVVPPRGPPVVMDLPVGLAGSIVGQLRSRDGGIPGKAVRIHEVWALPLAPPPSAPLLGTVRGSHVQQHSVSREMLEALGLRDDWQPSVPRGDFAVVGLPAGRYELSVLLEESATAGAGQRQLRRLSTLVDLETGASVECDLDLDEPHPGGVLQVRVRWPRGEADHRAVAVVLDEPGQPRFQFALGVDEGFTLDGLPAVDRMVIARAVHADGVHVMAIRDVPAKDSMLVLDASVPEVRFRRSSTSTDGVRLHTTDPTSLMLRVLDEELWDIDFDDRDVIVLFGLPPGRYVAHFDDSPVEFELRPGETRVEIDGP